MIKKIRNKKTGKYVRTIKLWSPRNWNNGYVDNRGRFRVYRPDCPRAYQEGYALRTHVVWWLHYGECHPIGTNIHHRDENKLNDHIKNLELKTHSQHSIDHNKKSGVSFTCLSCSRLFNLPEWKVRQRTKEGTVPKFCSQLCYHNAPRSNEHRKGISSGLKRAYRKGIRFPTNKGGRPKGSKNKPKPTSNQVSLVHSVFASGTR